MSLCILLGVITTLVLALLRGFFICNLLGSTLGSTQHSPRHLHVSVVRVDSLLQLHDLLASDTHFLSRLKHSVSHSLGIIVGLLGLPHSVLRFGSGSWHDDLSSTLRSVVPLPVVPPFT